MLRGQSADAPIFFIQNEAEAKKHKFPENSRWCWLFPLFDVGLQVLELSILLGQHWEGRSIFRLPTQNCHVNPSMPISTSGSVRKAYGGGQELPVVLSPHEWQLSQEPGLPRVLLLFISKFFVLPEQRFKRGRYSVPPSVPEYPVASNVCFFYPTSFAIQNGIFFPPHQPIEKYKFTYGQILKNHWKTFLILGEASKHQIILFFFFFSGCLLLQSPSNKFFWRHF